MSPGDDVLAAHVEHARTRRHRRFTSRPDSNDARILDQDIRVPDDACAFHRDRRTTSQQQRAPRHVARYFNANFEALEGLFASSQGP